MKSSVPALLSFNGGYADTAGYLALQGLFTAHVTGNIVTLGAALAIRWGPFGAGDSGPDTAGNDSRVGNGHCRMRSSGSIWALRRRRRS